jgi:hypothetical protein
MDTRQERTLGTGFAHAFAAKDGDRIRELVHPEIDFKGLTPSRHWEASGPEALVSILFENWLEDSDRVDALEHVETDSFADRERIGYRLSVSCPDGRHVVEQQAYIGERDGRIGWMRVVCSGFRPVT